MPTGATIDELNNPLREIVFRKKKNKLFKKLSKNTNFSFKDIEALAIIHKKIVETLRPMNMNIFRDVMHSGFDYTENIRHFLIDRVFTAVDTEVDAKITTEEWITGLSTILKGNIDERIKFAYKVYDWLKTNKLRKDQIFQIMKGCVIRQQPDENLDESVKDMIELLLKKMDTDRDGDIAEDEFESAVKESSPFYLESMGPVFPSREARYAFLSTFSDSELLF